MSKQVYYEGLFGSLTPVHTVEAVGPGTARATVSEDTSLYSKGNVITTAPQYFVVKVGFRDGFLWVRQWTREYQLHGRCDDS